MRIKVLILIVCFFCAGLSFPLQAQEQTYNPFLAGALSWYNAGLGQIYTRNYVKGIIYFVLDSGLFYLTLNSIADIELNFNETLGIGLTAELRSRKDLEYNSVNATFFLVSYLAFHLYGVFDAVMTAYNDNLNISFQYEPRTGDFGFFYTRSFGRGETVPRQTSASGRTLCF